jgi:deaminated glutathione amidase
MITLAAVQMVSSHVVDDNLQTAASLISQAAGQGAQLVALPENFALMGMDEADKLAHQERLGDGPLQQFLKDAAKTHGIYLLGGTIPIATGTPDKVFAASLLFSPTGDCLVDYNKIHLFDVTVTEGESHQESKAVMPGKSVITTDTDLGCVGLSVCYDLRFPEMYRQMAVEDVDVICIPAAFTEVTGRAHWEVLCRARAIENLSVVVAPNQGGRHTNGRDTFGHSMVIDHWGQVLACCEKGEGIALAEVDVDAMHERRRTFPVGSHRRLGIIPPQ